MNKSASLLAAAVFGSAVMAGSAASAATVVVLSENFNSSAFQGVHFRDNVTTDYWASSVAYQIANAENWTFTGSDALQVNSAVGPRNGSLLLNECCINGVGASASIDLGVLVNGKTYTLTFQEWGDNEPGQAYVLDTTIGATAFSSDGVDGQTGSRTAPTLVTYSFKGTGQDETLTFAQASTTQASPVIDNILITTASVPEPMSWTLMALGVALMGATLRRRTSSPSAA